MFLACVKTIDRRGKIEPVKAFFVIDGSFANLPMSVTKVYLTVIDQLSPFEKRKRIDEFFLSTTSFTTVSVNDQADKPGTSKRLRN